MNFSLTKLKSFLEKVRQSIQSYLNQHLVIGSLLKSSFEATFSWKTNVVSVWNGHFSCFCKFLIDKVETILWESEAKRLTLFKLEFCHTKLLRKWFWSYLELKNKFLWAFENSIFQFFANFSLIKLKAYFWKDRQSIQGYLNQNLVIGGFLENSFKTTLSSKTSVVSVSKEHFSVFC